MKYEMRFFLNKGDRPSLSLFYLSFSIIPIISLFCVASGEGGGGGGKEKVFGSGEVGVVS